MERKTERTETTCFSIPNNWEFEIIRTTAEPVLPFSAFQTSDQLQVTLAAGCFCVAKQALWLIAWETFHQIGFITGFIEYKLLIENPVFVGTIASWIAFVIIGTNNYPNVTIGIDCVTLFIRTKMLIRNVPRVQTEITQTSIANLKNFAWKVNTQNIQLNPIQSLTLTLTLTLTLNLLQISFFE